MDKTFKIEGSKFTFRVKHINAIEALALQQSSSMKDTLSATKMFKDILERLEVDCDGTWLSVKEKGKEIYYPAGIEDNVICVKELVNYFLNDYLLPLFMKSKESK